MPPHHHHRDMLLSSSSMLVSEKLTITNPCPQESAFQFKMRLRRWETLIGDLSNVQGDTLGLFSSWCCLAALGPSCILAPYGYSFPCLLPASCYDWGLKGSPSPTHSPSKSPIFTSLAVIPSMCATPARAPSAMTADSSLAT